MQKLPLITALTLSVLTLAACQKARHGDTQVVQLPSSTVDAAKCPDLNGKYTNRPTPEKSITMHIQTKLENGIMMYTFNDGEQWISANGQAKVAMDEDTGETGTVTLTCPEEKTLHMELTKGGSPIGFETIKVINDAGDIHVESNLPDLNESADYMKQ